MVHQARRSSTIAAALSIAAYSTGRDRNTQFNFMHCTPRLLSFFERLGFRQYVRPFHDPEIGPQVPLVLVLEDVEHLRTMRSPFLEWTAQQRNSSHTARWFLNQFCDNQISEEIRTSYEFDRLHITPGTI
jgi:hypothetical protein